MVYILTQVLACDIFLPGVVMSLVLMRSNWLSVCSDRHVFIWSCL